MQSLPWELVSREFAFDGSWRDIIILHTDLADWQVALNVLRSANYKLVYYRNDQPSELPSGVCDTFPLPGECDRRLSIWFAGVLANSHFFTPDEIEFDIDPREITGQQQLDALFEFMKCLADAVGKPVALTAENCSEISIFRIQPDQATIEYRAFGGWHDWRK